MNQIYRIVHQILQFVLDSKISSSSLVLEDNTSYNDISDFSKLIKFFREGDKLLDSNGNIYGINNINSNNIQLSPYSLTSPLTSNSFDLLFSIYKLF